MYRLWLRSPPSKEPLQEKETITRQQLDDIMHERERQRDRREAAMVAADRSVEIAQSYVVPAFERGA